MPIPSRVLGAGNSSLSTVSICGDAQVAISAAGTTAATATLLSTVFSTVGTTAASTGVKLPPTEAGALVVVSNDGAQTLTVYPQTSSTIDGSASVTIATTKRRIFVGTSGTTWSSLLGA